MESSRIHRSGKNYVTTIQYKAPKRRPIPLTFETWSREMSEYPNKWEIRFMWRIRSKQDIVERMHVICAEHRLTMRWKKVPMIVEWLKHENPRESDPQIRIDMEQYGGSEVLRKLTGLFA